MISNKWFCVMTDKFMSNWGKAEGKINKYIIECKTLSQAETIKRHAEQRREMKYINIVAKIPYYSPRRYILSIVKFEDLGEVWKK